MERVSSSRRCVVIGAGFAGLAAAEALVSAGVEVVVFEARSRVGGRVWSFPLEEGSIVELGAEFVLPGYETLRTTAARVSLSLFEKGTPYGDREPRGGPPVTRQELLAALAALAALEAGSAGSAAEVLERYISSPGAQAAIAARVSVSTAYELADQPASVLTETAAAFGAFPSHSIAGGNDLLAKALAARLGASVRLSTPARRVLWSERGVTVGTRGGAVDADACVVATPAPHALELVFEPPLPPWKRVALEAVRYGDAAKLFLPLAAPAAPSATLSVPERFWTWTQRSPEGPPLPIASSFAGTSAALERLGVDRGPHGWVAAVRRLRPDLELAAAPPLLHTWHDDPWARGSYSVRSRSSPLDEDALARPVGPIAFAGEHTAGDLHGLMEGALRSGLRAAGDVGEVIASATA
jgi:monoamine oxidase